MKNILRASLLGTTLALTGSLVATQVYADTTESASQYLSASAITAKVKAALLGTKGIDSTNIKVTTVDPGVVTLDGVVDSKAQVELAGRVVAKQDGVQQVQNNLKSAQ